MTGAARQIELPPTRTRAPARKPLGGWIPHPYITTELRPNRDTYKCCTRYNYGVPKSVPQETIELSIDRIVSVALDLVRAEGIDAVTMRRLAQELGVSQMAPYYYINNKTQLLEFVADQAIADLVLPPPEFGSWTQRWKRQIQDALIKFAEYPGLGDVCMAVHLTPRARQLMHEIVEMLLEAGFDRSDAHKSYALVHTYIFGRVGIRERIRAHGASGERRDLYFAPLARPLHGDDFEEYAVDILLAGIGARTLLDAV